jgi:hypothetical protein
MILMRLAVTLMILMVFTLGSLDKWMEGTAPQWFIDQFGDTWMGTMPQTPMYLGIAFLEGLLAIGALVSLVMMEWLSPRAVILKWTLAGVLFMFIILGLGARVSGQFADAASHFMYFSGTLLMLYVVDRSEQAPAT